MSNLSPQFDETGTPRDKQWLIECAELVKHKMPDNYSFVVFGFPNAKTDRCFYISNATRETAVEALKKWIKNSEATFGKHLP